MRSRWFTVVSTLLRGALVASVLVACQDAPSPSSITGPQGMFQAAPKPLRPSRGAEDAYLDIESRVPGFGGLFTDSQGDVVVYLAPNTNPALALREVREHLAKSTDQLRGPRPARIVLRRGKFGFGSLVAWQQAIARGATRDNDIALLDADESTNRVRVMVRSQAALNRLPGLAARLGIPASAIAAEVGDFVVELTNTLNQYNRPAAAGLQIMALNSVSWNGANYTPHIETCTMGFNIIVGGQPYMMTASHCTNSYNGQLYRFWYQPSITFDYTNGQAVTLTQALVGQTAVNPAWRTDICTPGASYCRETDAMLIKWRNNDYAMNVYVSSVIGTGNNPGNQTIGAEYPVVQAGGLGVGTTVYKTGAITGTTSGPIVSTCVITPPDAVDQVSLNCGTVAQLEQRPGDSGAPVFRISQYTPEQRFTDGIASMRATVVGSQLSHMVYSQWGPIMTELGLSISQSRPGWEFNSSPPPSPSFGGAIVGETQLYPHTAYEWSASTQNGTGPYQYQWYVDGQQAGTDSYLGWQFSPSSSHTISVEVADAAGNYVNTEIGVIVNTGTCAPEDTECAETRKGRLTPIRARPPVNPGASVLRRRP